MAEGVGPALSVGEEFGEAIDGVTVGDASEHVGTPTRLAALLLPATQPGSTGHGQMTCVTFASCRGFVRGPLESG